MKSKAVMAVQVLVMVFTTAVMVGLPQAQGQNPAQSPPTNPEAQVPQVALPVSGSPETLRVLEGRSLVVNSNEILKRVSVTNETVATAIVVSPNQVLIHGLKPGIVSLLLWNEQEQTRFFDLQVLPVPLDLEPLRLTLAKVFPGQDIQVSQSGASIVLTGTVSSTAVADQVAAVAKTEVPGVVSLLTVPVPANHVVMLEVKFAEVQRNAVQQLGANILSTGALNTPGTISTQQFSTPGSNAVRGTIPGQNAGTTTTFQLTDLLNIFIFRPDLNLALMIKALQQRSLLEVLAEPNLLALGGHEASFLAGGEFPVPVIQGATGAPVVSVQFKEFGVRLKFTADISPDKTIRLHVNPEVSALDFTNAVTLSGFLIPALTTRRADTEVQLQDGQSFAIAGLLDNRINKISSKIPWLGDVPILGKLFQSTNFTKAKTELLVMVTPRVVKPLPAGQMPTLPEFPIPPDSVDGKVGAARAKTPGEPR